MDVLLEKVVEHNTKIALVDIRGIPLLDTQTGQFIIDTISAVRLLGASVILTGVRPQIAQTLVHLGIDLSHIITRSSLASGLREALISLDLMITDEFSKT
jgi:rsbT co-antagonist protein RsbR